STSLMFDHCRRHWTRIDLCVRVDRERRAARAAVRLDRRVVALADVAAVTKLLELVREEADEELLRPGQGQGALVAVVARRDHWVESYRRAVPLPDLVDLPEFALVEMRDRAFQVGLSTVFLEIFKGGNDFSGRTPDPVPRVVG